MINHSDINGNLSTYMLNMYSVFLLSKDFIAFPILYSNMSIQIKKYHFLYLLRNRIHYYRHVHYATSKESRKLLTSSTVPHLE